MKWLLIPFSDRFLGRRVVSRVDQILGFPRTLTYGEDCFALGSGRHVPEPRTETHMLILQHDETGAEVLHGAFAVGFAPDVVDALRERVIEWDSARKRLREWIADQGWMVRDDLPGERSAWAELPPRAGEPGSVDGEPIPEGAE